MGLADEKYCPFQFTGPGTASFGVFAIPDIGRNSCGFSIYSAVPALVRVPGLEYQLSPPVVDHQVEALQVDGVQCFEQVILSISVRCKRIWKKDIAGVDVENTYGVASIHRMKDVGIGAGNCISFDAASGAEGSVYDRVDCRIFFDNDHGGVAAAVCIRYEQGVLARGRMARVGNTPPDISIAGDIIQGCQRNSASLANTYRLIGAEIRLVFHRQCKVRSVSQPSGEGAVVVKTPLAVWPMKLSPWQMETLFASLTLEGFITMSAAAVAPQPALSYSVRVTCRLPKSE